MGEDAPEGFERPAGVPLERAAQAAERRGMAFADEVARARARSTVAGVTWLMGLSNIVGAVLVAVYLGWIFPSSARIGTGEHDIDVGVFLAYVIGAVLLAVPYNRILLHKSMRWIRENRAPTTVERWNVLIQPIRLTVTTFVVWVGAALLFGVVFQSEPYRARVSVGVALGGLITCAMQELLLERHFRPVFALVLDEVDLPRWRREILTRVMVGWWIGSAVPLIAIGLAPLFLTPSEMADSGKTFAVIGLTAVIAGGLVMRGAAGAVSEPLNSVTDALSRVQEGDLDVHVDVTHIGEIGRLQQGVNRLVSGLRDRRRIRDLFGRQVGLDPALVSDDGLPRLGGEAREITALFVDMEGFTAFTLKHTPEEVVAELNAFFAVVIDVVTSEGGWVNKFEGDAALCIFGAPAPQEDHAARALRAAAALPVALAATPREFQVGIGVASGLVVAGNIGTPERHEFTVIGDPVNVAARLTELAKREHGGVLANQETILAAGDDGEGWHEVGTVVLRGRTLPTRLYEPLLADDGETCVVTGT